MQTLLLLLLIRTFISCFFWPPSADESRGEEEEGAVKKGSCSLLQSAHLQMGNIHLVFCSVCK